MLKRIINLVFITLIFSLNIVCLTKIDNKDIKVNEIIAYNDIKPPLINEVTKLKEIYNNDDINAILEIEDKKFIVAQTTDNKFYLNHDYYKNYNEIGSIFMDYRVDIDTSSKTLIYGHSSKTLDVDFNNLEKYYDYEYFINNQYIKLKTENNIYTYKIFSVYIELYDYTYMNLNFDDKSVYLKHIENLKNKSFYKTNEVLNEDDKILILQTCSNHKDYQNYSKKYLLIIARRVLDEK